MLYGLEIALDVFFTILLLLIAWILTDKLPMYNRFVDVSYGFNHPIPAHEPGWVMALFIWVLPIIFLLILHFLLNRKLKNVTLILLSWFNAMALVIFLTAFVRYFLPGPRPYFLTKCAPTNGALSGYMMDPNFCSVTWVATICNLFRVVTRLWCGRRGFLIYWCCHTCPPHLHGLEAFGK